MKRKHLLIALGAGMTALTFSSYTSGPYQGGAGNHTGSAGSQANCSTGSGCHQVNTTNTTSFLGISTLSGGGVSSYTPGTTYKITLAGANASATLPKCGFQASCVKAGATSTQAGSFASTTSNISVRNATGGLQLIEHNTPIAAIASSGGTNTYLITFNWTAPAAGTGTVRFYAVFNAVNGTGTSAGDQPNATSPLDLPENTGTGIANVDALHLDIYPNPTATNLRITAPTGTHDIAQAVITDVTGRMIPMAVTQAQSGLMLDVHALAAGTYQVSVMAAGKVYSARFIKQ